MQHMHDNIPYMFDCWLDALVHLLLLKSSMARPSKDSFLPITPIGEKNTNVLFVP